MYHPRILFIYKRLCIVACLETTLGGCGYAGKCFWTAGQRIDPSRESTFVWRTSNTYTTVFGMTYTNWNQGQPDYANNEQACMRIWTAHSYKWADGPCHQLCCSVCELDM